MPIVTTTDGREIQVTPDFNVTVDTSTNTHIDDESIDRLRDYIRESVSLSGTGLKPGHGIEPKEDILGPEIMKIVKDIFNGSTLWAGAKHSPTSFAKLVKGKTDKKAILEMDDEDIMAAYLAERKAD